MLPAKAGWKCECPQIEMWQKRCLALRFVRYCLCRLKIETWRGRVGSSCKGSVTNLMTQCRARVARTLNRKLGYQDLVGKELFSRLIDPGVAGFKVRVETLRAGTIHYRLKY